MYICTRLHYDVVLIHYFGLCVSLFFGADDRKTHIGQIYDSGMSIILWSLVVHCCFRTNILSAETIYVRCNVGEQATFSCVAFEMHRDWLIYANSIEYIYICMLLVGEHFGDGAVGVDLFSDVIFCYNGDGILMADLRLTSPRNRTICFRGVYSRKRRR